MRSKAAVANVHKLTTFFTASKSDCNASASRGNDEFESDETESHIIMIDKTDKTDKTDKLDNHVDVEAETIDHETVHDNDSDYEHNKSSKIRKITRRILFRQ